MFNKHDLSRNECMLTGSFKKQGYDWWWHSFTAVNDITGEERPFFIEYFLCNPELGEMLPVLGQLPENKKAGKKPSYLMVKVGTWGERKAQLHRFFAPREVRIQGKKPYCIEAGDCYASDSMLRGSVCVTKEQAKEHPEYMCDAGEMEWSLILDKQIAFNVGYGASRPMRALKAFEMFWHAEGMKTLYSGYVIYNGEHYTVTPERSFGYADKNWGRGFTSPWVWLSSCNLKSKNSGMPLTNSVFDIGGGRPKIGPIALKRKLLSAFYYEGKEYEFNFSKFWTFTRTKFDCRETETEIVWHVEQKTWRNKMVTDITCQKKDMLLINYEAPDGSKRHNRLWNGGNGKGTIKLYRDNKLIDEVEATHIGCEYGEYDK